MTPDFHRKFRTISHVALRIAAGLTFFSHGAQKILGWFGGSGPDGGTVELFTRFGAAGVIELVGGALIIIGLFTRPVAFLASGEMAVAYFWAHWGRSGEMWWWDNRGELALVYAFVWLLFAAWGAGGFSVDDWLRRRREAGATPGTP